MTPRQYLSYFNYDDRLINGEFYAPDPITLDPGDKVGVVLFNLGGPYKRADVAPFLYNLFMDPAIIDMPLKGSWRHYLATFIAKSRGRKVVQDYEAIGGGSPINRISQEQASALEGHLNETYGRGAGISFRTYVAMRYWHPTSEEAVRRMQQDGITKVLLLPLYPQYSKTSSGSSLMYWWTLEQRSEIPYWPTSFVYEYAANPKYIQAISERIDEGLQRFPREVRAEVELVFSAHGTPLREMRDRHDPYCCHIHRSVEQVMALRRYDRPFHVAFQSKVGPAEWLSPSLPNKLKEMAQAGRKAVLVNPMGFVCDHVGTQFELDMEVREQAEGFGITQYEVTRGLNSHPLFIEALGEVVAAQLRLPSSDGVLGTGDGAPATRAGYPLRPWKERPFFRDGESCRRCPHCTATVDARSWTTCTSEPLPIMDPPRVEPGMFEPGTETS
jgi:protoporphyrin/coproporphyrin ferrochelatase